MKSIAKIERTHAPLMRRSDVVQQTASLFSFITCNTASRENRRKQWTWLKFETFIPNNKWQNFQRWRDFSSTICCFMRLSDCKFIGKLWQMMPPPPTTPRPTSIIWRALDIYFSPSHSWNYSRITIFLNIGLQHK